MKTLVTGGAGFIGAHLVRTLVRSGRTVLVADDFSRGRRDRLEDLDVEVHEIDLRDYREAQSLFRGVHTVFHLAARVGSVWFLHENEDAELEALQTNLALDGSVFRACRLHGVRTIVYASSVSVYPIRRQITDDVVFAERDATWAEPDGGYGWAKVLGEIQLGWMTKLNVGIARLFNVYGEGEEPDENAHVVPSLIRKAILYPEVEFRVWGDGRQKRDLIYVEDVVEALVRLEEVASNPPVTINLGSGTPLDIRTIVEKIICISGKLITPVFEPRALVGPRSRAADITAAKRLLDWEPRVPIDEGLRRTYAWVEEKVGKVQSPRSPTP